ncbi:hypothetical protein AB6A23_12070 [Paenibacillus tarimensis]
MNLTIIDASMTYNEEDGYIGKVHFRAEGDREPYEITLHSKKGKDWMYSLNYLHGHGKEEEMFRMEERLEEDDELFDFLVETAKNALA